MSERQKSPKATIDENSQHRKFVWRRFSQQLIFFREGKFSAKLVPIYSFSWYVVNHISLIFTILVDLFTEEEKNNSQNIKIYYIYKDVYFI
jgi:hypothetical protein